MVVRLAELEQAGGAGQVVRGENHQDGGAVLHALGDLCIEQKNRMKSYNEGKRKGCTSNIYLNTIVCLMLFALVYRDKPYSTRIHKSLSVFKSHLNID